MLKIAKTTYISFPYTTALALIALPYLPCSAQSIQAQNGQSGTAFLSVYQVGNAPTFGTYGVSVRVQGGTAQFRQDAPEVVEVVTSTTSATAMGNWNSWSYQSVTQNSSTQLTCMGSIPSGSGTAFNFTDVYTANSDGKSFDLQRTVKVATPNTAVDKGFSTRFGLYSQTAANLQACDLFVPGMSYHNTQYPLDSFKPSGNLSSDLSQEFLWFREDRLSLPAAMLRLPGVAGGPTLQIAHIDEALGGYSPSTWYDGNAPEDYNPRLIDSRMQFGSMGFINGIAGPPVYLAAHNAGSPEVEFIFPGTEGSRSGIGDGTTSYRAHPLTNSGVPATDTYHLRIRATQTSSYLAARDDTYNYFYGIFAPSYVHKTLTAEYNDSMSLLNAELKPWPNVGNAIALPFRLATFYDPARGLDGYGTLPHPAGTTIDSLSGQMGYIGDQLPASYMLLKYALENGDATAQAHAEQMLQVWVNQITAYWNSHVRGLPPTWYDLSSTGGFSWRGTGGTPTYLRVASEGMDGLLQAWSLERRHGHEHPDWLAACQAYGDWLGSVQKRNVSQTGDGAWNRVYNYDTAISPDPLTNGPYLAPTQPIRFLADLYYTTKSASYKTAATNAGTYCLNVIDAQGLYAGGTADGLTSTFDKEAGMVAVEAFLSLYDLTKDTRYRDAAQRAARFCQTFVYAWNIPMPGPVNLNDNYPRPDWPGSANTLGMSMISPGSGSDSYMAIAPFNFYRLFLLAGDTQMLALSQMLLYNTKQTTGTESGLYPNLPGLQTEATSISAIRGVSVKTWLPWLTVSLLDPMVRLNSTFATWDLDAIQTQTAAQRSTEEAQYENTHLMSDTAIPLGKTITLRAVVNNDYVTAGSGGNSALIASDVNAQIGAASPDEFMVVDRGDGFVALKCLANGKYVQATNAGTGPLKAVSASVGTWEAFRWEDRGNGVVALKNMASSQYVQATAAGAGTLQGVGTWVGSWESFQWTVH